jgi:hypothetical protein
MSPLNPKAMTRALFVVVPLVFAGCAHLPVGESRDRAQLWEQAHRAFMAQDFQLALAEFETLAERYPHRREGREAIFYVGSIHLDPRNPAWNPEPAERWLRRYVEMTAEAEAAQPIHRRPEGEILLELARQLNLPVAARAPGLQPEPVIVEREGPERVIAPGGEVRALQDENAQLRAQLAQRDETVRRLQEELERIRRTLRPRTP